MVLSDWTDCQRFEVAGRVVAAKWCQGKDLRGRGTDYDHIDYKQDPEVVHVQLSEAQSLSHMTCGMTLHLSMTLLMTCKLVEVFPQGPFMLSPRETLSTIPKKPMNTL